MQRVALVGDAGKIITLHEGSRANTKTTNNMVTMGEREEKTKHSYLPVSTIMTRSMDIAISLIGCSYKSIKFAYNKRSGSKSP